MLAIQYYNSFKNGHKVILLILFIFVYLSINKFLLNETYLQENLIPVYSNYILTKTPCAGFGNQLFRFAIIYGIGRNISRTPIFDKNEICEMESLKEIKSTFPNLFKFIKVLKPSWRDTVVAEPFWSCCNYSSVEKLTQKYLIFESYTPFPIGFFIKYESEIKYLLKFDNKLVDEVKVEGNELFGNDTSPKLCIHFRRGDFFKTRFLESTEDFIIPAAGFIQSYLFSNTNISIILLGKDDHFVQSLKTKLINTTTINTTFVPNLKSRNHDLAFSSIFCDSLLISSSGSTFAWWIGYLLEKKNAKIFYNFDVLRWEKYSEEDFQDLYPLEWIKLKVKNNKTVEIVHR